MSEAGHLNERLTQQALQDLKGEVGELFLHSTIGILLINTDGKIVLTNPYCNMIFGYEEEEITGRKIEILIPEKYRKKHVEHRRHFFEQSGTLQMSNDRELRARRKSGEEFPVEINLVQISVKGVKYGVAFIKDVSIRTKAIDDLKKLNNELEQRVMSRTLELKDALQREKESNERKSRFVSMAAHELKTPLSSILSSISILEKYTAETEQEKRLKHYDRIKSAIKTLNENMEDFLSLDRIEHGRMEIRNETYDIFSLSEYIRESMDGLLKAGQAIQGHYAGNPMVQGDHRIISHILSNLLSNAVKFSPENSEVSMQVRVTPTMIFITVQDRGIGIPEPDQQHLFKMFHRAANARNVKGTGLGLNIVHRYVDLIHGKISFESEVNQGTTFVVEIPNMVD